MPTYEQEAKRLSQLGQRMTHGPSRVDRVTLNDEGSEIWATVHGHHIDPETGLAENWRLTMAGPAAISGAIVDVVEGCIRSHDMASTPSVEPEAMAGHLTDFAVAKKGNVWTGAFSIQTDLGPIRVCASADDEMIRQIVRHRTAQRAPMEASAGGFNFFKMVSDVTQKIARARILSRVARAFNDIAKNPVISQLTGLAKFVPILGPAINTAEQGGHQVNRAIRRTRQVAQRRLAAVRSMAPRPAARLVTPTPPAASGNDSARQQLAVRMAQRMFNGS